MGSAALPGHAYSITVSGTLAYVSYGDGISIVDIGDPETPTVLSNFTDMFVVHEVIIVDELMYAIDGVNGMHVLDLSDPLAPANLGSVYEWTGGSQALAVAGDHAYVGTGDGEIHVA